MTRGNPMRYRDAVRLLCDEDSTVINALDQGLGLGLLAVTAFSPASALPFFDLKSELIAQLRKLRTELIERVRHSDRIEYDQLVTAAHAVIVMASHAEILAEKVKKLDDGERIYRELKEWRPQSGAKKPPGKYNRQQFVEWAGQSMIDPPGPTRPLENVITDLNKTYRELSKQALEYLEGLQIWDELRESQRIKIKETFDSEIPKLAILRYRGHFIRLASDIPDFMTWILLNEGQVIRTMLRSLLASKREETRSVAAKFQQRLDGIEAEIHAERAALGDLPVVLAEMFNRAATPGKNVARAIAECYSIHQLVLNKPMLEPRLSGDLGMIRFPSSVDGYVNPKYRITRTRWSDEGHSLAQDDTWQGKRVRPGLGGCLAGYLRSSDATQQPLLILGDPGSGKSLLSKLLAARLPPEEFAVIRVELRHVRHHQEIGDQINAELARQTNNRYNLQDLTDERGKITRVVIMDGLDELLQLSSNEGLGRYLEWLAEFQEVESRLGHPVIAIATARTIVMDRVYTPSGITVIKLEDFDDAQIAAWLSSWNRQNSDYFSIHNLKELDTGTIAQQRHLAGQPLLLALLALYDAETNALRGAENLSQAELYERIFQRYLERELEKRELPVRKSERSPLIEQRFRELSTIAMGMLNRGRRFITRLEVIDDFNVTGVHRESSSSSTPANVDDAVGQFFFLYRAQSLQNHATPGEGYEFIHGTFGEFLSARIIARQLARACEIVQKAPAWERSEIDRHARSLLAPYLDRRCLVGEEQVMAYIDDIIGTLIRARRPASLAIAAHVPALLRTGLPEGTGYDSNRPQLERIATLTVNLVELSLRTANSALPLSVFSEDGQEPLDGWRRLVALWQAYLKIDDWDRVLNSFVLSHQHSSNLPGQELQLSRRDARGQRAQDLIPYVVDTQLLRLIQTGRLTGDDQLRAAALVWSWVFEALLPEGYPARYVNVEWLTACAFFRLASADTSSGETEVALRKASRGSRNILESIVAGPSRWRNEMLASVASSLAESDDFADDVEGTLGIINELDKRGSFSQARKLLKRIPAEVFTRELPPADVVAIISLSRRHHMPELLVNVVSVEFLKSPGMQELTIEDIVWIVQSRSIPSETMDYLRTYIEVDPRYRRIVNAASELLVGELPASLVGVPEDPNLISRFPHLAIMITLDLGARRI
jgi:hypothetical protein